MAIVSKLDKDNNDYKFDFKEVYYKIDDLFIDTVIEEVRIGLRGYTTEYARQNNAMGIYKKVFKIKLEELKAKSFSKIDIIKAAYEYLMTQDEFKEAKAK